MPSQRVRPSCVSEPRCSGIAPYPPVRHHQSHESHRPREHRTGAMQDASRGGGPMAGAMRRMGIYLGLVEDDDPRGYGRYDSRQSDHLDDRRYGRYAADDYDAHYESEYPPGAYADDDLEAEDV